MWVKTIYSFLRLLADDVLILLSGKNPNYIYRRAEYALNTFNTYACNWTRPKDCEREYEYKLNILFKRKIKIARYFSHCFCNRYSTRGSS